MTTGTINFNHLTLAALFQFFTRLIALINKIGAEKLGIEKLFNNLLLPAFQKLDDAYKQAQKSEFTAKIKEIDKLMDNTTSSILGIINAMLKSNDAQLSEAANNLKFLFGQYKGITRKPLNEQAADTTNLLQSLKGKFAADIEKLGLEKLVAELEKYSKEISSYIDFRVEEKVEKSRNNAAEAKKGIIEAYRAIFKAIDVNILTDGTANYDEFIRSINVIISEFGGSRQTASSGTTPSGDNAPATPSLGEGEFSVGDNDSTNANGGEGSEGSSGSADDRQAPSYPDAKEYNSDAKISNSFDGDIFFVVKDGKKEYYKLLDRYQVTKFAPGTNESVWEKLN